MLDLTSYAPKPFEMRVTPDLTVTSPAPSVKVGKMLAAFMATTNDVAKVVAGGNVVDEFNGIDGWPDTIEESAALMLGDEQTTHLIEELNLPEAFITQITICAILYWAYGANEQIVRWYLEQLVTGKVAESAANTFGGDGGGTTPKGQKRSKNGRRTASAKR